MLHLPSLLPSALLLLCAHQASASTDYRENLLLRPLPNNALLASFNFRSNVSNAAFERQNFGHFPRSFGQILQHTHTKELHIRFSLGRWDADEWGQRPWNGSREGGTGVELWAWVDSASEEESQTRWLTLTNALSGLFCASLNFIDGTRTIRPVVTFEPEGIHPKATQGNLHLLHGTLPHEVVCTENLTPFLKLLPCKGKAGIASLLDGHKLFDSTWQTMAIDVRPICGVDGSDCTLEIEQSVDMVLDIDRSKRPRDNPIPRPVPIEQIECDTSKYYAEDSCFPLVTQAQAAWSISDVFGRKIAGSCSLDSKPQSTGTQEVCLNVVPERELQAKLYGEANEEGELFAAEVTSDPNLRCWTLPEGSQKFNLELPKQSLNMQTPHTKPDLHAARSITGYGQERGRVHAVLRNQSPNKAMRVVYLESLPWYMKPYVHTLKAELKSTPRGRKVDPIQEVYYRPALDRHRGTHLELVIDIPAGETVTLTYDFDKAILRYTEYPPDANRGFDVAPAVVRLLNSGDETSNTYVRTTSLLLPLPTPDFSMPYNVIILTSTVMALAFGGFFNLLVRRFVAADELPKRSAALLIGRLKDRIRLRLASVLPARKKAVDKLQ